MVSIKDIAKRAGVSISTVSYALNGSPKVTPETAEKIRAIAKELNYVPHAGARSLKKKESSLIGVFLSNYSGVFYGQLLQGISETLTNFGYDLIVCSGERSHRFIPERRIDGSIILDSSFSTDELLSYANVGHKIIVLDREIEHPNIGQVLLDNKAGSTLAIDYLIDNGHRKIYLVTGPKDSYDSNKRVEAVRQTINHYKSNFQIEYYEIEGDFNKTSGELAAKKIIGSYDGPVAVFCLNDEMAIGLYDYLQNSDLIIGKDVHVIGFDNIEITRYTNPRLATIDYSKRKWGALAAEQLIKLINEEKVERECIYVTLITGESVRRV
ncbi:LacI family DNA-binding transcriptional regulator [Caldifermentibacillus hisashii]|uniref:LacI family DNA-binding transcriptional regulator n=1 Tax=Caldifermentibacillus hisashii TaxID=996558 RepID=A0ABU9K1D3_9BACI|nr:LacI family DNA-binding transcriptional regulator [Caldibacillus thermoamylovorans]MCM3054218.1 LacI family transcriptional regulator [Caldibacillus thermoamylovorans]